MITPALSGCLQPEDKRTVIEEPSGHLSLTDETFQKHVQCDAIVQCLGHNLSFKGLFGHPRRLCADTVKRLCDAVMVVAPRNPIKLIVINNIASGMNVQASYCNFIFLIHFN